MAGAGSGAKLLRVNAETFAFIALQVAAMVGMLAVLATLFFLGSHGPELDD